MLVEPFLDEAPSADSRRVLLAIGRPNRLADPRMEGRSRAFPVRPQDRVYHMANVIQSRRRVKTPAGNIDEIFSASRSADDDVSAKPEPPENDTVSSEKSGRRKIFSLPGIFVFYFTIWLRFGNTLSENTLCLCSVFPPILGAEEKT